MPIPAAEIELPDIETLDTPFKRRIALFAAVLVVMGGVLALGASSASDREQSHASEAQRLSITASSEYGEVFSGIAELASGDAEFHALKQRAELARVHGILTGSATYAAQATSWEQAAKALEDLKAADTDGPRADDLNAVASDLLVAPRVHALQSDALRETATAWGAQTDRYVLGITLLAVALSLLGLALTVTRGTRGLLVVPAALITVLALATSAVAFFQAPTTTPDEAVRAMADGDRSTMLGRYADAVDAYTEASRVRPDYAQAYRALSVAESAVGGSDLGAYVFLTIDEAARERAIEHLDTALSLSPVPDYLTLVNQGANLFHVREYELSEEFSRRALDINDRLPLPWFNLALVQAAQGRQREARATYEKAIRLTQDRPDPREQAELFASSRGALEVLVAQQPSATELVQQLKGLLVAGQAGQAGQAGSGQDPAPPGAKLSNLRLSAAGIYLHANYEPSGLSEEARVSWIGYFRPASDDPDAPWRQPQALVRMNAPVAAAGVTSQLFVDYNCPSAGEYRLEAWLGESLLASATATVSAVADRYLLSYEPSGPVWVCRPADWVLDDAVPGRATLSAPGGNGERLTIQTVPLPAELIDAPGDQVVNTALDTMPGCSGWGPPEAESPTLVGNVNGSARRFAPHGDGRGAWCWAGLGSDRKLRIVVADYTRNDAASGAAIDDLVSRISFF